MKSCRSLAAPFAHAGTAELCLLLGLMLIPCLGSCQSMAQGVLSFEARALAYDDSELERLEGGSSFSDEEVDLEGYGGHLALMTPIFDVLGGVDWRDFDGEGTPEVVVGLRRRFLEIWRLHPYVEGDLRYGSDLDTGFEMEDYTGWSAGGGLLLDLTGSLFLNARLMYDTTPIAAPGPDNDVTGLVGTVGLGLAF